MAPEYRAYGDNEESSESPVGHAVEELHSCASRIAVCIIGAISLHKRVTEGAIGEPAPSHWVYSRVFLYTLDVSLIAP